MTRCVRRRALASLVILVASTALAAKPGDVFREYRWTNEGGDAGGSLRVGGRLDYGGEPIDLPFELDLTHAIRAEAVIEKLLCHDGTRGLSISLNGHEWLTFPEAQDIPEPQWEYQHHIYPVIDIPLEMLKAGTENQFRLKVDDEHTWNWPQNLIYGVHLRIFYDTRRKPHPAGKLITPAGNAALGSSVPLKVEASSPNGPIERVDFLGNYEGVNLEGDGRYTQWHYHYVRAKFTGHIGTATEAPWTITWDTTWIPDQPKPFQLAAWITDSSGLTLFTPGVDGLRFDRDLPVELCRPYDVPKQWVTRKREHEQRFRVAGDLAQATAARLVWCSWSPGYLEGVFINDEKVFHREGPKYAYFVHRVDLDDLSMFRPGENVLKTGKTPKYNGKMVHGTEINWPGIMVLIQYRPTKK